MNFRKRRKQRMGKRSVEVSDVIGGARLVAAERATVFGAVHKLKKGRGIPLDKGGVVL